MQFISLQKKANKLTFSTNLNGKDIRDIALSSVFFIFAYAPSPFGFLIYFAFIPQLLLYRRNNPFRSAVYGYLIGLIVNSCVLYWLLLYGLAQVWLYIILYIRLYVGLYMGLYMRLYTRLYVELYMGLYMRLYMRLYTRHM